LLKLSVGLATALALSFPALSSAQDGAANGEGNELEEITVTARKRVENLQDKGKRASNSRFHIVDKYIAQ